MNTAEEIDFICSLAEQRKSNAEPEGMNHDFINPSLCYLTSAEKERLHQLKLMLPSTGEEIRDAKERIKKRINKRNQLNKRKTL